MAVVDSLLLPRRGNGNIHSIIVFHVARNSSVPVVVKCILDIGWLKLYPRVPRYVEAWCFILWTKGLIWGWACCFMWWVLTCAMALEGHACCMYLCLLIHVYVSSLKWATCISHVANSTITNTSHFLQSWWLQMLKFESWREICASVMPRGLPWYGILHVLQAFCTCFRRFLHVLHSNTCLLKWFKISTCTHICIYIACDMHALILRLLFSCALLSIHPEKDQCLS